MENEPDAKRMAAAVAAAAAAAAANADPFGALRSPGMPGRGPGGMPMNMPGTTMIGLGPVSTEEIAVPDKMVGLSKCKRIKLIECSHVIYICVLAQSLVEVVSKFPVCKQNQGLKFKWPLTVLAYLTGLVPLQARENL